MCMRCTYVRQLRTVPVSVRTSSGYGAWVLQIETSRLVQVLLEIRRRRLETTSCMHDCGCG